jgi:hypothetical protein
MIVDIVDKYCTNDNNPIKNLRLKSFMASANASIMEQGQVKKTTLVIKVVGILTTSHPPIS